MLLWSSAIAGIGGLILGILILLRTQKKIENTSFSILAVLISLVVIFNYFSLTSKNSESLTLFWIRAVMFVVPYLMLSLYYFASSYLNPNFTLNKRKLWFWFIFTIVLSIINILPISYLSVSITNTGQIIPKTGPGLPLNGLHIMPLFFLAVYNMVRNSKNKKLNSRERKMITLSLYTFLVCFGLQIVTSFVIVTLFNYTSLVPVGNFLIFIFVIIMATAIFSLKTFNITMVGAILFPIVLSVLMFVEILTSSGLQKIFYKIVVFCSVTFIGYQFIKSIRKEIRQREEMEELAKEKEKALDEVADRNRNLLMLQKFSDIILDNEDLKPMIQQIINTIPKEIENCAGAVVALADVEEEKMRGFCISQTQVDESLMKVWEQTIKSFCVPLSSQTNLLMNAYHHQLPQKGNHLSDFMCPPFDKAKANELQTKSKIKGLVAIPLSAKDEKFGVVVVAMTKHVEDMKPEEIGMLTAIANEVSLAVQRALAFENLKTANEYLKELDKMKDEFISVASHELNTPLAAIQGYLSMILEEGMGKVDKTAEEYLQRVYSSSKRLAALILDLLNVSRIEQGRIHLMYGQTKPEDLVKSVIDELIVKSDAKNIYLKFKKPEKELPSTWCDINRIREVLINLVGNGIKFTDKGGITIAVQEISGSFEFSVTDTGAGIKKEDADKLFKKFSQLNREKNEFQGSGLGLFISKKLIELHGGKIWIESEEGKGATFKFRLPIVAEKPVDEHEGEGEVLKQPVTGEADKLDVKNPMSSYLEQQKVKQN